MLLAPLSWALLLATLATGSSTSLVAGASDARLEQVELKPCAAGEHSHVGCAKLVELKVATKTDYPNQDPFINLKHKASKPDPIVALMDEISRLRQELIPTRASLASGERKEQPTARSAVPVSSKPAGSGSGGRTVCEKSLALGTLGYRILCQPQKGGLAAQHNERQKQKSRDQSTQVAGLVTTGGADMPQEGAEQHVEQAVEAVELRRLRSLFEQLDKRGNFRPIVQ